MSGHSKWSSIKHKKAATDAKRGKAFTKIIKEITVAAKIGGGEIDSNPRLRQAIDKAKALNMPSDNIKKATQKGTGELEGVNYEEISYEGYGPGGVAILIETLTDNKNRTVAEIRHAFDKYNGKMGEQGCVGYLFSRNGLIIIPVENIEEEELMELVLENGADDLINDDENYEVITSVKEFDNVLNAIKEKKIDFISAEISMIPSTMAKVEGKQAHSMLKLYEKFEDLEDVQNVWTNFDISDEDIESYNS